MNDLLIAAHAHSLDATPVTANTPEFRRVPGLNLENWMVWARVGAARPTKVVSIKDVDNDDLDPTSLE